MQTLSGILILSLCFFQSGGAFADNSQEKEQIKQVVPTLLSEISNLDLTDEKDHENLKSLVHEFIYVKYVAVKVLGNFHWKKMNKEEQEAFTSAYLDYLIAKFVPKINSFLSSGVLEFDKVKKRSSRYIAHYTYIKNGRTREQGETILWSFKKDPKDEKYKIINISNQVASLVQFSNQSLIEILNEDGATALIKAVKARRQMALERSSGT